MPGPGEESSGGFGVSGADGKTVVNSRVSGAVYAMAEAAKKDGLELSSGSGFRTMAHQQSLCPCDGITVARPGYSNHQMGLAIDFSAYLPSTPGPIPGNKYWDWLSKNAGKFGFKNYPREAWHWSPTGS
jgi:D-alanyl-D-alanine carboxypeptidase